MYLVFKHINDWFAQNEGLEKKFQSTYGFILLSARDYANQIARMVKEKIGIDVQIEISELLLKQAIIDALDDLLRLKNYHPTDEPNPIKEMSYIVYWLIKRDPIRLVSEDVITDKGLSDIAQKRLLFINEEFGVKLLMNAAFAGRQEKEECSHVYEQANKQLKYFKRFLLYYLVYRIDSPKSLEAILLGCTIHPVWKVDPVIWSFVNKDEDFSYENW